MATFTYTIDLDERGFFRAHVDNSKDETVFNILAGNELAEDESSIFDDGFMNHKNDLVGLESYLQDLEVIGKNDVIEHS